MKPASFSFSSTASSILRWLKSYGFGLALFAAIAAGIFGGISSTEKATRSEKKAMLEDNVRRSVISCYTLEGAYPMSLDYLIENYNLKYDEKSFVIHYSIFASNMFPDYDIADRTA